ncbi:hypothetical protein JCM10207_003593 [Rhodosporidiobolus poonsookiae]
MSDRPPDADRDPSARSPSPAPTSHSAAVAPPPHPSAAPPLASTSTSSLSTPSGSSSSSSSRAQSALGVASGRTPRGASAGRRSSRRASLDPYPSSSSAALRADSPAGAARLSAPGEGGHATRRVSRSRTPTAEAVQKEDEGGASQARGPTALGLPGPAASDRSFRLVMLQQPEIGAEAGLKKNTLGRLPVVPAPVVEVIVEDPRGERVDQEFPFLFCSCSLRQADGVSPVEVAPPPQTEDEDTAAEEFSALVGGIVRQSHRISDLDGNQRDVFVFEDVSVRTTGQYTLEFTLSQAVRPKSPRLAAVRSNPFDVVEWQEYPGRPVADTVPELSLHLHHQGVPMYIPPLLLSQPSDNPPPAGSNPFPPDMDALAPPLPPSSSSSRRRPSPPP